VAERLRRVIERSVISLLRHNGQSDASFGVSGVTLGSTHAAESWERLIGQAEEALERASARDEIGWKPRAECRVLPAYPQAPQVR